MTRKAVIAGLATLGLWGGCRADSPEASGPPSLTIAAAPMHRLNRTEYRNTVRDLLGSSLDPAADFPADDIGLGFDNIARVLSISPLQLELYERAAGQLAADALRIPKTATTTHVEAENLQGSVGAATATGWNLWSNGSIASPITIESGGDYQISARVWAQQAGPELAKAALLVGESAIGTFAVAADANAPMVITKTTTIGAGPTTFGVAFLNDYYQPPADRNLYVDWIEIEGPLGVVGKNPIREKIVTCDPKGAPCRRTIAGDFARRAWRRPPQIDEIDRLAALMSIPLGEGDTADVALQVALTAILLAPQFIFRPELDDDSASEVPHPLGDYELASRLSYFVWSSMPDEKLLAAAAAGTLRSDEGIASEVGRMLADPKAAALVDSFADQWLLVRSLADHVPDYAAYPSYDDALRGSMKAEAQRFFGEVVKGSVPLNRLLTADFTFLNARLAKHYGLPFSGGGELQKIDLAGNPERFGLLTLGSILTVTSYPTRTSPVKRGVFILEHLLCDGPAPPPPGVEGLLDKGMPSGTLRQRLEKHRANPVCASCHKMMDPLGFGLEHYDGIGAFRAEDKGGFAIDAKGTYTEAGGVAGASFDGARKMAELIQADPRFSDCLVNKLFVYALGRGVDEADRPHLAAIAATLAQRGHRLPDLVKLIAQSAPFRMRRGTKEVTP